MLWLAYISSTAVHFANAENGVLFLLILRVNSKGLIKYPSVSCASIVLHISNVRRSHLEFNYKNTYVRVNSQFFILAIIVIVEIYLPVFVVYSFSWFWYNARPKKSFWLSSFVIENGSHHGLWQLQATKMSLKVKYRKIAFSI